MARFSIERSLINDRHAVWLAARPKEIQNRSASRDAGMQSVPHSVDDALRRSQYGNGPRRTAMISHTPFGGLTAWLPTTQARAEISLTRPGQPVKIVSYSADADGT
jgi:hypothetical protein